MEKCDDSFNLGNSQISSLNLPIIVFLSENLNLLSVMEKKAIVTVKKREEKQKERKRARESFRLN